MSKQHDYIKHLETTIWEQTKEIGRLNLELIEMTAAYHNQRTATDDLINENRKLHQELEDAL